MKKLMNIGKWMLTIISSVGLACIGIMREWNDATILATFLFGGILVALVLGLFDIKDSPISKNLSIKHGARSMRRAA